MTTQRDAYDAAARDYETAFDEYRSARNRADLSPQEETGLFCVSLRMLCRALREWRPGYPDL